MEDSKTIWAVSTGSYSDYSVIAIMATKELAEEYANLHADSYHVEEFDFLDSVPVHIPVLYISDQIGGNNNYGYHERMANELAENNHKPCLHNQWFNEGNESIIISVYGTDFERVRKVYSEQRAQAMADPRVVFV